MKNKLLLCLLPTLLALSACGGVAPKLEQNLFEEDTLEHKEIFGDFDASTLLRHNLGPVDPGAEPLIGVQTKTYVEDATTYKAIRFLVALNVAQGDLSSTNVTWTREMFTDEGNSFKPSAEFKASKAYSLVYQQTEVSSSYSYETVSPSDFGDYNYFAAYTMKKITLDKLDYYLKVSVQVNDSAYTKVVATTIDQSKQVSFDSSETGYFLKGTIGGEENQYKGADTTTRGSNAATFSVSLLADDVFSVIWNDVENHKFSIFGYSDFSDTSDYKALFLENTNEKAKVKYDGDYVIYLNGSNSLYISVENGYYLVGVFSDWKYYPYNKLGEWDEDNYAIGNSLKINVYGDVGVAYVKNGEQEHWYGPGGIDGGNWTINRVGLYNVYINKSNKLWIDLVQPLSFEVYITSQTNPIYVYLYNSETGAKNAEWRGVSISSFDKNGNNYIINYEGFTHVIFNAEVGQLEYDIAASISTGVSIHSDSYGVWQDSIWG